MSPWQSPQAIPPSGAGITPEVADRLARAAQAAGHRVVRLDLGSCRDKPALLAALARAFAFPDWFGHNWDALADSLGDLAWLPAPGYLLLVSGCATPATACPDDWHSLGEILDETADTLAQDGRAWVWHRIEPAPC
ncbi:MAG: barstar family protein [Rhodocyclaceae bacterium]|nr:barstar family protein [Rhodocyclaceae bacterium]